MSDHNRKQLSLFWMPEKNFGDALNEVLLPHFGVPVCYGDVAMAEAVGIGSILDLVPPSFGGFILGAGFMWEHKTSRFVRAEHLVIRGQLSAERCHAPSSTLIGDPGLLVGRIFQPDVSVRYTLGIVPHYADRRHRAVSALLERYPRDLKLIDVRHPVEQVVAAIAECEQIISSSLHGLIAADALAKPNKWVVIGDGVLGGGFKFRDYFSAFAPDNNRRAVRLRGEETLAELLDGMHTPDDETVALIDRLYEFYGAFSKTFGENGGR